MMKIEQISVKKNKIIGLISNPEDFFKDTEQEGYVKAIDGTKTALREAIDKYLKRIGRKRIGYAWVRVWVRSFIEFGAVLEYRGDLDVFLEAE